jgi:hypothetical protein
LPYQNQYEPLTAGRTLKPTNTYKMTTTIRRLLALLIGIGIAAAIILKILVDGLN